MRFLEACRGSVQVRSKAAGQSGGEIHVLHVIDMTMPGGSHTLSHAYAFNVNFLNEMEQEADLKFRKLWEKHAPMTMKIKFRHRISSFTIEVEKYISENTIDLVLMGTHGDNNTRFGSNTEKIVRQSPVPVISIRKAPDRIRNILLPSETGWANEHFIREVNKLQSFFNAQLHLLYVNTPLFFRSDSESTQKLTDFARKNYSNYTINVRADYTVEAGIAHFAKEINADMIALGTHAWKGLAHLFIGSVTEDTLKHLKMPLWTFHLR